MSFRLTPRLSAAYALAALAACAGPGEERTVQRDPSTAEPPVVSANDAGAQTATPCTPTIPALSDFTLIYDPSADALWPAYINDHTFAFGPDARWHLFGITHAEPGLVAKDEREFAHAASVALTQPAWTKLPNALSADASVGETVLWAPHVVQHDGRYWMFYAGGGSDGASYQLRLATSTDLTTWTREVEPLFVDGYEARDPFVLRVGARWILYYTATDEPSGGHHVVAYRSSDDLLHWSERAVAYVDSATGTGAGPTESPFLVAREEGYYLFIGSSEDYLATRVFYSQDPLRFSGSPIARLELHAPELVRDLDGREYISHAGWGQGGVRLAPLTWRCNP